MVVKYMPAIVIDPIWQSINSSCRVKPASRAAVATTTLKVEPGSKMSETDRLRQKSGSYLL